MATDPATERVVYIRTRTILQVLGIVLATLAIDVHPAAGSLP